MIIAIRLTADLTPEQKRELLFNQALSVIHNDNDIDPSRWLKGVKVGTVISHCMLNLKTKGTTPTIEFDPDANFSHLLEDD